MRRGRLAERENFFQPIMIDGIRVKICGLTSLVDAEFAGQAGFDYLGFNLYPKSPRCVPMQQASAILKQLQDGRRTVAVMVEPTDQELAAAQEGGFEFFQIHFRHDHPVHRIEAWSRRLGPDKLWLAPKLPVGVNVSASWLPLADAFLLDTFDAERFGGSGRPGDWKKFCLHQAMDSGKMWILAGGLNPDNIGAALAESGARAVDLNSGVEVAPGIKDHAKMRQAVAAIRSARASRG